MSIFAKPPSQNVSDKTSAMFLHGLEGSTTGTKATYLANNWSAKCPVMRTRELSALKAEHNNQWDEIDRDVLAAAFKIPYTDALTAINYAPPDVVIGSSMGGAILFKLMAEGIYTGPAVFCAPAIFNLLPASYVDNAVAENKENFHSTVWLLGETDTIVSNKENIQLARKLSGSIIVSPNDCHRLNKAVKSDILNSAVTTAIELSERS